MVSCNILSATFKISQRLCQGRRIIPVEVLSTSDLGGCTIPSGGATRCTATQLMSRSHSGTVWQIFLGQIPRQTVKKKACTTASRSHSFTTGSRRTKWYFQMPAVMLLKSSLLGSAFPQILAHVQPHHGSQVLVDLRHDARQ